MARQAAADARNAYLVGHYRPGLQVPGLKHLEALVRAAIDELEREGRSIRLMRTTIVPADESVLCIVEAESEELLSEAYGRAGISFDRISVALPEQAPSSRATTASLAPVRLPPLAGPARGHRQPEEAPSLEEG